MSETSSLAVSSQDSLLTLAVYIAQNAPTPTTVGTISSMSSTPPSGECANTVGAISKPDVDDAPFDSPNARAP